MYRVWTTIMALAVSMGCYSIAYAEGIEGFWKSMDDQTGQPLSLVEIRKTTSGVYEGTIVHRYSNSVGYIQKVCDKCAPPNKGKSIIGLKMVTELRDDPNKPNHYIGGKVLDVRNGRVYNGKANVRNNGQRLHMRGNLPNTPFGRTQIWSRADGPTP